MRESLFVGCQLLLSCKNTPFADLYQLAGSKMQGTSTLRGKGATRLDQIFFATIGGTWSKAKMWSHANQLTES